VSFDQAPLVPATDHEFFETKVGIELHDVPKDWPLTDFNERLWQHVSLFRETGPKPSGQNDDLHWRCFLWNQRLGCKESSSRLARMPSVSSYRGVQPVKARNPVTSPTSEETSCGRRDKSPNPSS